MSWEKVEQLKREAQTLKKETFNPEAFFKLQEIEVAITILIKQLIRK